MWKAHYDKINKEKHPPANTLSQTLNIISNKGSSKEFKAIDLGCGNGVDTFALLEKGFDVLAIDKDPNSFQHLQKGISSNLPERLNFQNSSFESLGELPSADLVNASFSLPFCHPHQFERLWLNIISCINSEGFFCGHFFGPKDSWSSNSDMTFHNLEAVKKLFEGFELLYFEETSKNGKTLSGKEKFWHVFHVVAKKYHSTK
ncbi:bifunctional 2-polyprenyl-6-hydroxyphenol methylase/3-demethylubiquinol 3-O-methyltransferase UbiG [Flavivirga sp. 57AJ16]|uniref:class I SAM-dependent methyltransferase n=1 Tax=Flavivirga sp. 57AJ16 TaxID=3025307 RepID=UPI0023656A6C|nr:class I SAM-dependent methyltransferase [Flavivirga sp. 57AJ16]MDD7884486.1 class I SAM-dependent methyltransferase [Flavivirga sp. 57AJ16]